MERQWPRRDQPTHKVCSLPALLLLHRCLFLPHGVAPLDRHRRLLHPVVEAWRRQGTNNIAQLLGSLRADKHVKISSVSNRWSDGQAGCVCIAARTDDPHVVCVCVRRGVEANTIKLAKVRKPRK